jgi:multiple sugar transport system permease protein
MSDSATLSPRTPSGAATPLAGARPAQAPGSGQRLGMWMERHVHYWLMLPAAIAIGAVLLYPMVFSFWISFFNWPLSVEEPRFIGLRNYTNVLTAPFFHFVLLQSVAFALVCLGIEFVLGMALALLLNIKFRGRGLVRTLFLLPMLTAPILTGFNFRWIFNDRFGLANQIALMFGHGESIAWLSDPTLARICIVIVTVWSGTPFVMLLLLAGLQSLPEAPYEAAIVDGATWRQRFWYITLPLLRPVMVVAASIRMIDLFRVFDTIYIMTGGGPGQATELFPFYVWRSAFSDSRLGFASALSYVTLAVTLVFLIPLLRTEASGAEADRTRR